MQRLVEARKGPGPPARYKGKRPRAPLSPLKGFLILLGVLVLALFLSLVASVLAFLAGIIGPSGAFIIPMLFLGAIIPFLLGMLVKKWGWTIGLSYTLLYLFLVLPWYLWGEWGHSYMWITAGRKHAPYYWIPLTLAVCFLFSFLGSYAFRKRRVIRLNLEKPAQTLVPVVALCVFLSVLAPFTMDFIQGERAKTSRCPQYNFQLITPKGWSGIRPLRGADKFPVFSSDMVREEAEAKISIAPHRYTVEQVDIYVYRNMPFTGVPVESFNSREELYESLKKTLQDVEDNPGIVEFAWYGHTEVDGLDAVRLLFKEWSGEKPDKPLPETLKYGGEVWVYNKPYLYSINWIIGKDGKIEEKEYKEVMNSIEFIEKEP